LFKNYYTNNFKLTSAEIGSLWSSYVFESMVHHIFSYFSNSTEDDDIKTYIDSCRLSSRMHLDSYKAFFEKEQLPTPRGTTSDDVNENAPKLFSDKFHITYIKNLANFALVNYSMAYAKCSRDDTRQLFKAKMDRLQEVDQMGTEILISKGIYNRSPHLDISYEVEFVEKEKFFAGFLGNKRHLSVLEINQLFFNLESNLLGRALMIGFSQVAKSKELHDYLLKGKELSDKYIQLFSEKLLEEDISGPPSLESEVLPVSSGQPPFSDRFMLNHTVFLNTYGIGNYGLALSQSQRHDLQVMFGKIVVDVGLYASNGADLLIHNKWLEQPPLAPERNNLYQTK
jgi:hypothetical protein